MNQLLAIGHIIINKKKNNITKVYNLICSIAKDLSGISYPIIINYNKYKFIIIY